MSKPVVLQAGDATLIGDCKRLTIGRPQAVVTGGRWGRRVLRVDVLLSGPDEDVETQLEKLQAAITDVNR